MTTNFRGWIMEVVSKTELKRQKVAAKLKIKLEDTAKLLREYATANDCSLKEQGKPTRGSDNYTLRLAKEISEYSTFF